MTESVIADFPARFLADSATLDEPVNGRVLLSEQRLVLATGDEKRDVPLSAVFDVTVGQVPTNVSEFFDDTVTIGYEQEGSQRTAIVESTADRIDRFSTILFRARLNGAKVTVKHPARVGGRVVDAPAETGSIKIGKKTVTIRDLSEPVTIDLFDVIDFEKTRRTIQGRKQLSLLVRHMSETESVTTEMTLPSGRKMNILGRYFRLEYSDIMQQVRDVDVTDAEVELLVALYSGAEAVAGESAALARLLGVEANRVGLLLDRLEDKGLVVRGSEATSLTSMGRMMIGDRMEEINV